MDTPEYTPRDFTLSSPDVDPILGAIIGEFMAASRGLGYMIQLDTNQFDTTGAASGILVLMLCVMLFIGALNRLERYVLRWRPRERAGAARELQ